MQWATAAETQAICDALPLWLDDQRQLLEQDYVMLKIDDVNDTGGVEIFEKMSKGMMVGVPFHAIYDAAGASLNLVAARMWTGLQGLTKNPLTMLFHRQWPAEKTSRASWGLTCEYRDHPDCGRS